MDEATRVLVVDDSKTMRNFLVACLEKEYATRSAADGQEGLDILGEFSPEVVLLDVDMPRMDGLEFIRRLRHDALDTDTYVIVLSGHQEQDLKSQALNLGANDYLTKPCNPEELLSRVNVARRQTSLTRELRRAYGVIREEIRLVSDLQTRLLPKQSLILPGASFRTLYRPSGEASGDYYDFFRMDGETVRLVVADVSGKGARAAFVMAIAQSFFHSARKGGYSLTETLGMLNGRLLQVLEDCPDFLTLFAADYHPATRELEYVNAGHCPGLVIGPNGTLAELGAINPPAGFFEETFLSKRIVLEPGAALFLYTDGFYEWERPEGEMFEIDAFIEACHGYFTEAGFDLEGLFSRVRDMAGGESAFRDDLTALLLVVEG